MSDAALIVKKKDQDQILDVVERFDRWRSTCMSWCMTRRILAQSARCALILLACATSALAQSSGSVTPLTPPDEDDRTAQRRREQWLLSVEGVTHAPVDIGFQLGVETPFRLRLFGAYGWVPSPYMNLLTGIAAGASDSPYAEALLKQAEYSGRTWRLQAGVRPFRALGLYGDLGYASVRADGS